MPSKPRYKSESTLFTRSYKERAPVRQTTGCNDYARTAPHRWPAGLSPLAPISPVITWDEASAAGRCTVADAVMAHDALGRWPLDEPVVCGDKRGALLGCSLVRCTCTVCEATTPEGCLFPLALWEKHATLRRNAPTSIVHAATQLPLPQWLTAQVHIHTSRRVLSLPLSV